MPPNLPPNAILPLTLARLREWVRDLQARYGASERQVCFALRISYRRVHVMLRREGWWDNHKRIVVQRQAETGVSERELIHVAEGCTVQNQSLAHIR